ncbi:MAG TPA: type IV pilus secretin PilQ [Gammaproteobacteria bacterium]|nr:type IV pilus secretin PilQ [Gammaproteobacteria bacterium]
MNGMNVNRKWHWERMCRWLLVAAWSLCSLDALADEPSLNGIKSTALPGDKVQVRLELSSPPADKPLSFTIDNPARIALDFPGTKLNLANKTQTIGSGAAQSVSAVEAGGRTRVVLNLVRMVGYDVKVDGNDVVVTLDSAPASISTSTASLATAAPAGPAGAAKGAIEGIDFRRGDSGEGMVMIKLTDPATVVNINEEGGQIIADFVNTQLPENLDRRLEVTDFATPVKDIDTRRHGNGTRMRITPVTNAQFEHLAYQMDNLFTIELKPLTKEEQEASKKDKFGYTGEKLSLNFQNIEVRAVLQLLADFTGLNLVASDTVTGNVTLRLKNVPWDQALDIILRSKGLAMRQAGNVIMVAPAEEIATREKLELEQQKQVKDLAPLHTEFVQVNYAKADDIAKLLKAEKNTLISDRGSVSTDERTNTLLIQETVDKITEIRKLVSTLDRPVKQVLIESRIVVADDTFSRQLGVRFGYSRAAKVNDLGNNGTYIVGGKVPGDTTFFSNGTATPTAFNVGNVENYIVSLPVTSPAGAVELAVGKIGSYLLQLELSALQAEGRGEVISSPRVITADKKEAVIQQGTEIPYQQASSSGATSVSFKSAVLSLKVTPNITPDDRIIMDLAVNKDAVGQLFAGIPSIDTNSVTTQVLVDNGETVVLGGVYTQTNRNDTTRVPFFSDLPYFGFLFRNTSIQHDKKELLIFVTPKIIKESLALQ